MTLLPFTGDLVRAFGWTILHSAWQALFVYACLRVVLAIWPMASAKIKYNLATVSLMSIFTWFIITLFQQLHAIELARTTMEAATLHLQLTAGLSDQPVETIYKSQDHLKWFFPTVENWFPALVALYVIGFSVMTIKLFSDLAQLQQIRTHKTAPIDPEWELRLQQLTASLRIPRKVQLLVSDYIQVPVMLGFFKPLILLPVAMVNNLTPEQLEAILLHELAHIKRNDYLLNIFQSIVETILFFNPFVWLISRIIRQEREHCCDDLVIRKVQPLHYAHALVALEEYRLSSNSLAMAAADNKQHLFNRIKRIMEMKTKNLNYSQRLLAVLIIATGIISIAWLNPAKVKASEKKSAEKIKTATAVAAVAAPSVTINNSAVTSHNIIVDTAAVILDTDTLMPAPPAPPLPPAPPALQDLPPAPPAPPAVPSMPPPPPPPHVLKNGQFIHFSELSAEEKANIQKQINVAQASVERAMKQLKGVDMKKTMAETQKAIASIDMKQLQADLEQSSREMKLALANLDKESIMKSININIDSLSRSVKTQLRETRNYVRIASDSAARAAERGMHAAERAREQADRAREQADKARTINDNRFHQLIAKLTSDKLIDAKAGYSIIKKGEELIINGEKQSAAIFQKYQALMKEKNLTIKGTANSLDIDAQD